MLRTRWADSTDRLLVILGVVLLGIFFAWYAFEGGVQLFRIQLGVDEMTFLTFSATIPKTATAALLLLFGWGLQRYRRHPSVHFLRFVLFQVAAWAASVAASIWLYILAIRNGNSFEIGFWIYIAAGILEAIALFFLLLLVIPPRTPAPAPQFETIPPPAGPSP